MSWRSRAKMPIEMSSWPLHASLQRWFAGRRVSRWASTAWGSATLTLPRRLAGAELLNVFTGERSQPAAGDGGRVELPLARLFNAWPVAMLVGYPL